MYPSLEAKLKRYDELERMLQDPAISSDPARFLPLQREQGGLIKVARAMRRYRALKDDVATARALLEEEKDHQAREYAKSELEQLLAELKTLEGELEELASAGDSATRGSLIMEIRAGTGGDEAALFARELFDMYKRFADKRGWKYEVLDFSPTELGGVKEVVFSVTGEGAFQQLQFESGGHRVQRVPETEAQGRIHTSAATVAVLPEVTEVEVDIRDQDLQIDTMRASGPGGQKVNKTESAIRITHLPTGIVVKCQDEKSQHKNKAKAMRQLRSRIFEHKQQQVDKERSEQRRSLIGGGNRNERIRTYNFPQGRVTDHRIGLTLHKIDQFMQGDIDELVGALVEYDRQERLNGQGGGDGKSSK
ncbi:MAG TPA: peptide chain release factor 1 [Planctomycetaceae bacterium]|nr:peptide chain release factor 1 [Planctomycetaceae bacterium]